MRFDSVTAKKFCVSLTTAIAAVGELFTLICLGGGRAVYTKGGCLVEPTVNPEFTALGVRNLRIRITCLLFVKPIWFVIVSIKRDIY